MPKTSALDIEGATIVAAFHENVKRIPGRPAMRRRTAHGWETFTWADYGQAVSEVVAGLAELGIGPGECVAILAGNRVEWHLADVGALVNGGVTVPIYPTSSADQVGYILGHSNARLCFVENDDLLAKVLEVRATLPKLDRVVVFDATAKLSDPSMSTFSELRAIGAARLQREPGVVRERAAAVVGGQPATLVYTSGTTGPPKAAVLTHANIMWTIRSAASFVHLTSGERFLSFLPLSHVAERGMSEFAPIAVGGETWFARSLATVAEDLLDCRPTVFFAVPRIWEKLQTAVLEAIEHEPWPARNAARCFIRLGRRLGARRAARARPRAWDLFPHALLDATVGTRIRHGVGLDRAHVLITAAAPIHPDLVRWLHAIGLPVVELYGQTEVCGPTTCNPPEDNRVGTVGRALPGVHVTIAEDGEILVQGGNVCAGYYHDPASTAALLDSDGWMHSGDLGVLDADGYLRLTGRKKDLIITAAGQNVAPQDIEMELKSHPLISEAVVIGDGRRYLTALLTLDAQVLGEWADEHGRIADYEALAADADLHREIEELVGVVNTRRSRAEGIRRYRILARELTVAAGELTPTLKVRRAAVCAANVALIEDMYAESA